MSQNKIKQIISEIKECIVFLGFIENGQERIIGTSFLINIEGLYFLVTAKHVVKNNFENLFVFYNSKQYQNPIRRPLKESYDNGLNWILHKNIDIAVIPFLHSNKDDKVRTVPESLIVKDNDFTEIHELIDVFYLSYQPGLNDFEKDVGVNPIVRKGVISRINNDNTFYIDGAAFPGNSGSPVFLFPTVTAIVDGNGYMISEIKSIKLLGIIGSYITYNDIAISPQTNQARVVFQENTGLSLVYSTKSLMEITETADFRNQIATIKKNPLIYHPEQNNLLQLDKT